MDHFFAIANRKPFISFVTGIEFNDREAENKKLMDDAEALKKQLKPLDAITDKVNKIKGGFDDAAVVASFRDPEI